MDPARIIALILSALLVLGACLLLSGSMLVGGALILIVIGVVAFVMSARI